MTDREAEWYSGMKKWLEYQLSLDLYDDERIHKTRELERINEVFENEVKGWFEDAEIERRAKG